MNSKKLTTWEGACIVTGYGIGGGVLTMPYLAERNGILVSFIILAAALFVTYVLHMMIADVTMKSGDGSQIVAVFSRFLFRGRAKNILTITFFVLMALVLLTNLAAYVSGAAEILAALFQWPLLLCEIIFYILAASVVLFGLKAVGVSEKIAVAVIFGLIAVLAVASFFADDLNSLSIAPGSINEALAYFGMAMFAMSAFFSVPQAVDGLDRDEKKIKKAIFLGFFNNFIIIIVITICSLLASTSVTEVAMIGWSKGIGEWAQIVGSVFTVLAMLTTYWSISYALSGIIEEQTKLNARLCWVLATVPSLILALIGLANFMEFMRLAGGLIAIIIAVMVIPTYRIARREVPGSILSEGMGGTAMQAVVMIGYILMAVGNVVPV